MSAALHVLYTSCQSESAHSDGKRPCLKAVTNEYLNEMLNCACVHVCLPLDCVVFYFVLLPVACRPRKETET